MKDLTDLAGNTARFITFIDIDEDGRMDFLVQRQNSLAIVYNNQVSDSFFIKALMLNSKLSSGGDAANFYGDTSAGVSYRFIVTDLDDNKYVTVGTQ